MLEVLTSRAVFFAVFVSACSGDHVAELALEDAGSVFWLFAKNEVITRAIAVDPDAPAALKRDPSEMVYALVYPFSLSELQVSGELNIPAEDAPHRRLPAPERAFVLEGEDLFSQIENIPELRLPPLDPYACAENGGCFDAAEILCRNDCGRTTLFDPAAPRPIQPPASPNEPSTCRPGWMKTNAGCALIRPPGPSISCPKGQQAIFGETGCRWIARRCNTTSDPNLDLFVDPSRAGGPGTGAFNDPFLSLDDAIDAAIASGEKKIIEVAPGIAPVSRAITKMTIRGWCAHEVTLTGDVELGDDSELDNLVVEGSLTTRETTRLIDVGVEGPLIIAGSAITMLEHGAARGAISIGPQATFTATVSSVFVENNTAITATLGSAINLANVRIDAAAGRVAVDPSGATVTITNVEIAGFCRGLDALEQSRLSITDLRISTRTGCPINPIDFPTPLVFENRSSGTVSFYYADGDGPAFSVVTSATATISDFWTSTTSSFYAGINSRVFLSRGYFDRGPGGGVEKEATAVLEDVVLGAVGDFNIGATSTVTIHRLVSTMPITWNIWGRARIEDLRAQAPKLEVSEDGRLELIRAELSGGSEAIVFAHARGELELEDVRSTGLEGHLVRLEDADTTARAQRVSISGGGGLVFSLSSKSPAFRGEDVAVEGAQNWQDNAAITLFVGSAELNRIELDGARDVFFMDNGVADIESFVARNISGRVIRLSNTSSVTFSRMVVDGSGYMLDQHDAISVEGTSAARFFDTSIKNSGSLQVACVAVHEAASLSARRFRINACPLGLLVRRRGDRTAAIDLFDGAFARNQVAVEVPAGFALGALLRDVVYLDNEVTFSEK